MGEVIYGLNGLRKNAILGIAGLGGAEARYHFAAVAARLKSGPVTKPWNFAH